MKDEDKNYNLEEDDEDEDFMIGGTNDDIDEEPEEPEREEEAETRLIKNLKERLRLTTQRALKGQIPKRRKKK